MFQCSPKMTIIYVPPGWTTMFWNFPGWFQHTCFVTSYNYMPKHKWTFFIPISTIDLCMYVNSVRDLGWCHSGDQTHTCMQGGVYSALDNSLFNPFQKTLKRGNDYKLKLHSLKDGVGGRLGFSYLGLHSKWLLVNVFFKDDIFWSSWIGLLRTT